MALSAYPPSGLQEAARGYVCKGWNGFYLRTLLAVCRKPPKGTCLRAGMACAPDFSRRFRRECRKPWMGEGASAKLIRGLGRQSLRGQGGHETRRPSRANSPTRYTLHMLS